MKTLTLLSIFSFVSFFSFAQSPVKFGFRAGVTSAGMQGDAIKNLDNLVGFTNGMITTANRTGMFAGGVVQVPVSEVVSIEPGLFYSQKGYVMNGKIDIKALEFLGIGARATLQQQYVDLPVVVKANINGLQVFAGPQVSYLLQSNLRTSATVFGINVLNTHINTSNYFNNWDAAITGGIGYAFANGLHINASYDYGLTRVDANRNVASFNRAVKVGVGLTL